MSYYSHSVFKTKLIDLINRNDVIYHHKYIESPINIQWEYYKRVIYGMTF